MAISNLAELKTAITDTAHRGDLSSYLDNLILLGEKWIFRHVRSVEMETAFSEAIASGVVSVPTGFLGWKNVRIDGTPVTRLEVKAADWIYLRYPTRSPESVPKFIAREGSSFIFGPYPDSTYTVKGTYYTRPTSVLSSATTFFTNNPDLYLFASLSELEAFKKDDKRVPLWQSKRDAIAAAVNGEDDVAEFSGPLTMAVG